MFFKILERKAGMGLGSVFLKFGYSGCLLAMLLIGLPSFSVVYGQTNPVGSVPEDSTLIVPRSPDVKHIEAFRNDRDYNYHNDPVPSANPLEGWLKWITRKFVSLFSSEYYGGFLQYAAMAIMAGLVIFFLYKAKVLEHVFSSERADAPGEYVVGEENIHEINFEESIADALEKGDYRLGIRLQYLKLLKLLTNRELIYWKPSQTNQRYLQELEKYPFHEDFVHITRYFEFVWYGDFQIDEAEFKEMKAFANSFQEKAKL
jgi:hypothetical protein